MGLAAGAVGTAAMTGYQLAVAKLPQQRLKQRACGGRPTNR